MPIEYDAQILKLRLPEQDQLKNDAECCSADPAALNSIGRTVGHQIRIEREDDPRFFALYTVKLANPPEDVSDPSRVNVVRTGQAGRERLGTTVEIKAVVHATVVDTAPPPSGARFFEMAENNGRQTYLIAVAPHGGAIEERTDEEAEIVKRELVSSGYPASAWICKGYGDDVKKAFDRWHITSTDLHPASFPLLQTLITRRFRYGVAFHGFSKQPSEADVYIGGRASQNLKRAIKNKLDALNLPLEIRIATTADNPKFQACDSNNLINRIAIHGIQLEQSTEARTFHEDIARAIVTVYRSGWRRLVCAWMNLLR